MEEVIYDFRKVILFWQRKAWLLVLGLLLGAGLGYMASNIVSPIFQATTKVMITRAGQPQSSDDFTTYLSDLQLTQTYVQLLTTETVLGAAGDRLNVKLEPADLDVHAVENTQIIVLRVEDGNPERAALIANTMIEVLMERNETIQAGHYAAVEQSLRLQKEQLEVAIQDIQSQIRQTHLQSMGDQKVWLESQLAALQVEKTNLEQEILQIGIARTPETRLLLNQKNARLDQVQSLSNLYQNNYNELLLVNGSPVEDRIDPTDSRFTLLTSAQELYQQDYASVLSELESVHLARLQNVPSIVQIEIASTPEKPIRPVTWLNTVLGAVIGLVFMIGVAFLVESLNDTLKTKEGTEKLLGLPVIGLVDEIQMQRKDLGQIYVAQQPDSLVAEDFRVLRTNLDLASSRSPIRTILVTSSQDADGKTTVAANLAVSISQADKKVALLEADLRHPQLQSLLRLSNPTGVSTVLTDHTNIQSAGSITPDAPNLMIVPAGKPPSNPAELLSSKKMGQILTELKELVDVIVIDTPPSFLADAQILASKVDAILFVVRPGVTHVDSAQDSIEMLKRTGDHMIGLVMNRIPRNQGFYHGRKTYLSQN